MTQAFDDRYQTSTPVVSTSAFTIDFPIFSLTGDLEVYVDSAAVTAYTVTGTAADGKFTNATLTLDTAIINQTLEIVGTRSPARPDDLINGSNLIENMNADRDRDAAERQEIHREAQAAIRGQLSDGVMPRMPALSDVKGKYAYFNAVTGRLEGVSDTGITVSTDSVIFPTRTAVSAATIDAGVSVITTGGYAAAGDGGGALYARAVSEPSHVGKVQSADGAWWEIVPEDGQVNVLAFGLVGDGATDNRAAWETLREYKATEKVAVYFPEGNFTMTGATADASPSAGPVTIIGAGRDVTTITGPGQGSHDLLRINGDTKISGVRITAFEDAFDFIGAGDFLLTDCKVDACDYLVQGDIDAHSFIIRDNIFDNFDEALILDDDATITGRAEFSGNIVSDVQRYVYRAIHDAPLYFADNTITNVHAGDFTVARVIMHGSNTENYITGNTVKDVVSTDDNAVLVYWSRGDLIIHGNTFGKFQATGTGDAYLVHTKTADTKSLSLRGNTFLGGDDTAIWTAVVYHLNDRTVLESGHIIDGNTFYVLKGGELLRLNWSTNAAGQVAPGNILVTNNIVYEMNAPAFVGCLQGVVGLKISGNYCQNHHNAGGYAVTGSTTYKAIFTIYSAASYAAASRVQVSDNDWRFTTDGESSAEDSGMLGYSGFGSAPSNSIFVEARGNRIEGADSIVWSLGSVGTYSAFVRDTAVSEGLGSTRVGGLTAAKALITLTEAGAWTSSSNVWTFDGNVTVTATTGTLPTPDGSVTIADAAAPTNAELLEAFIESNKGG